MMINNITTSKDEKNNCEKNKHIFQYTGIVPCHKPIRCRCGNFKGHLCVSENKGTFIHGTYTSEIENGT